MIDPLASLTERRDHFRMVWRGRVWATDATGTPLTGELENLSVAGLSFVTDASPLPNTQLSIYVQLMPEGSQPIVGTAEVLHTTLQSDGRCTVRCRVDMPLQ